MNIVISAHFDLARPVMFIKMDNQKLLGLVDNFAGLFVAYQVSRKIGTTVYYTNYEELDYDGAIDVAKSLDKSNTFVVVIDTIQENETKKGKQVSIANAYGINRKELKKKFKKEVDFIGGNSGYDENETYIYGKKYGFKTFYLGIPIPKKYHATDNSVLLANIDRATKITVEIIKLLEKLYG
jgi:putative aminopeptidase FrvX